MTINPAEVISFENKSHFGVHILQRKKITSVCFNMCLTHSFFTSTVQMLWPKAFEPGTQIKF